MQELHLYVRQKDPATHDTKRDAISMLKNHLYVRKILQLRKPCGASSVGKSHLYVRQIPKLEGHARHHPMQETPILEQDPAARDAKPDVAIMQAPSSSEDKIMSQNAQHGADFMTIQDSIA